jgi:uncharacterized YigZ family protein
MESTGYMIPAGPHRVEQLVERSRFIATIAQVSTPEEARSFIDAIRAEYPDASHNCWAYIAGPAGSSAYSGMSDAGEPHGTAGRPMLDVLLHSGVGEVAAVVTRYFGGVKLGKGGLVRAYGGAVQHALATLPTVLRVPRVELTITVGYSDIDAARRTLEESGAELLDERYGETVHYIAAVPVAQAENLALLLADRTAGRADVTGGDNS